MKLGPNMRIWVFDFFWGFSLQRCNFKPFWVFLGRPNFGLWCMDEFEVFLVFKGVEYING